LLQNKLDENNFILYAARHYDNAQCYEKEEFYDDLKRFKYLKRLFVKYEESNELRERLILNHLIILYNVFNDAATPMLFLKLKGYYHYLKPFLITLGRLPNKVIINSELIYTSDIEMNIDIVNVLRKI
jgi:hypothetical protein